MVRIFCSIELAHETNTSNVFVCKTYKVDTDRRDVGLGVCVVGETEQQTRLSDTGISDQEELEQVVVPK